MNKSVFDARSGWRVLGVAVGLTLGVFLIAAFLYALARPWGLDPRLSSGTTLNGSVEIVIIIVAGYVTGVAVWCWVCWASGQRVALGWLAALPVIGFGWSLVIAARVVRRENAWRIVPGYVTATFACAVIAVWSTLPLAMTFATVLDNREQTRLAAPCAFGPDPSEGGPVVSTVEHVLGDADLERTVDAYRRLAVTAAGRSDPRLELEVANDFLVDFLIMESDFQPVTNRAAEVDGHPDACLRLTRAAFLNERGIEGLRKAAEKSSIGVDRSVGFWDAELLSIVRVDPGERLGIGDEGGAATSGINDDGTASPPLAGETIYGTRVNYDIDSLQDQEFDGLSWTADLCISGDEFLDDRFLDRVVLLRANPRKEVSTAVVESSRGGRCGDGGVNLLVTAQESVPASELVDQSWLPCTDYLLRIPETPSFAAAEVGICVSVFAATTVREEAGE